jgi:hypothetical protein
VGLRQAQFAERRVPDSKPPGDDETQQASTTRSLKDSDAGKVTFRHGTSIWEWNTRTGAFDLEETTMLLKRLDNPALSLESEVGHKDLLVEGEIAAQVTGTPRQPAVPSPAPPPRVPEPSEWSLQTWALETSGGGRNPYDSAGSPGSVNEGRGGEQVAWSLRSGRGRVSDASRASAFPDRERGYNPYGDDTPPRRRR